MPGHQTKRLFQTLERIRNDGGAARANRKGTKRLKVENNLEESDSDEGSRCATTLYQSRSRAASELASEAAYVPLEAPPRKEEHKLAELFRTDYISAMKVADVDALDFQLCLPLLDPWRQEWNRGVQVPVKSDSLPLPEIRTIEDDYEQRKNFLLPKSLIKFPKSDYAKMDGHVQRGNTGKSEKICRYDMDELDTRWLACANLHRAMNYGLPPISEVTMERIMEALETTCNENLERARQTTHGGGIEFDEDTFCDVCLSPFCDEDNEMIFCDGCEVCVHQACYGVTRIPSGNWLCRVCAVGLVQPECILCPNKGGAMKSTRSGERWAHVSCALWIPEIGFGDAEVMEPIINIAGVPEERWTLRCVLCKTREGACVQCSAPNCSTAFHVTCAQRFGLDIRVESDEQQHDVKLLSFCAKHGTVRHSPQNRAAQDRRSAKERRLVEAQDSFFEHADISTMDKDLSLSAENVGIVYEYWKLKRRANFNRPLLKLKRDEDRQVEKLQEDALVRRIRMLVYLRQNMEKARNLCYMVARREKLKKQWYRTLEDTFDAVVAASSLDNQKPSYWMNYFDQPDSLYARMMRAQRTGSGGKKVGSLKTSDSSKSGPNAPSPTKRVGMTTSPSPMVQDLTPRKTPASPPNLNRRKISSLLESPVKSGAATSPSKLSKIRSPSGGSASMSPAQKTARSLRSRHATRSRSGRPS